MKFFALYTNVKIIDKPKWLNEFNHKYGEPYDYHITLKQPCFVKDQKVEDLKTSIANYFESVLPGVIELNFSKVILDAPSDFEDGCIMLGTLEKDKLTELQNGLVTCLDDYRSYVEDKTRAYEKDFLPHITIGYHLSQDSFTKAVADLPKDLNLQVVVDEVVLATVADSSEAERTNPKNLTSFRL